MYNERKAKMGIFKLNEIVDFVYTDQESNAAIQKSEEAEVPT